MQKDGAKIETFSKLTSAPNAVTCALKSYLKKHILTHSRTKPFSCSKCNFSCVLRSNLIRHIVTYSAIETFVCSQCNYLYFRKSSSRRHMKKHTDLLLQKQPLTINNSCVQKSCFVTHMAVAHFILKAFLCSECSFRVFKNHVLSLT